ncbi:MAG: DUF11 domain-containing protein, partial [Paludibacter sp.]|nr:DUF11 domain-containing protein [Paludibacter sp.]
MKRKLLLQVIILFVFIISSFAEGTKTASPNATTITGLISGPDISSGSYYNCPVDNRLKFFINDATNEYLYFGFDCRDYQNTGIPNRQTNVYYRILNPDGTVAKQGAWSPTVGATGTIDGYTRAVNGPNIGGVSTGYVPFVFKPTVTGEHWIEIYRSNDGGTTPLTAVRSFVPLFDLTVANKNTFAKIDGRVYSNKWGFAASDGNFTIGIYSSSQPTIYAYTADQSIVKIAFQASFEPIAWNIAVNNYGVSSAGTYDVTRRSRNDAVSPSLADGYNVFLNTPDPGIFPVGSAPTCPNFATPSITGCGPYTIHYYLPEPGDVKLVLNLNGIAGFQANTSDRILEAFDVSAGDNTIAWDGKDGLGTEVASGTNIKLTVINQKGRFNVPLYDVELAKNGILASVIAPVSTPNATLYWDDSQLTNVTGNPANSNNTTGAGINNSFAGTVSPAHAWNGNGNPSQIIPAPAVGGNDTDNSQDNDFGNVRTINSWGWAASASSSELSLILGCADLSVTKTVNNSTPNVGSNVTFTITAANAGPAQDAAVVVTDLLPSGYTFVSATPSKGTYVSGTGVWTVGNIASGANATLQIVATVLPTGLYANTATITGGQEDPTPANNSATNTPVPIPVTDLSTTKSAPASVIAGQGLTYTIIVTNNGPSAISSSDQFKVTDALPAGFSATTYTASSGTYTSGTGAWTGVNIPSGGSVTLTIAGTVSGSSTGSLSNAAVAVVPTGFVDPAPANNTSAPAVTTINRQADLSITKSAAASVVAGQNLTYTITVTNNGPSTISTSDQFKVTDVLPTAYTATTFTPSSGTYTPATGNWT